MKKVIKFSAKWCQPCKVYQKTWDVVKKSRDDWEFVDVDVDDDQETVNKYSIRSVPTTIFEIDDFILDKIPGIMTELGLNEKLDSIKNN